ncbi:hypothetical protein PFBG_06181, partial [Plasmodium falciparum 7G8]
GIYLNEFLTNLNYHEYLIGKLHDSIEKIKLNKELNELRERYDHIIKHKKQMNDNLSKSSNEKGNRSVYKRFMLLNGKKIIDKKNSKNINQNNVVMNNNNNMHNNMNNNKIIQPYKMPMYNPNAYPPHPFYMNNNFAPYNNMPPANAYQNNFFDKNMALYNNSTKNIYDTHKNNTIIVTNVPTYLNAEDIFSAFQETGKIIDVQILMNEKRKLTGIVSIEYEKNESASDAVRMYDGGFLNDNRIRVFLDCR